MDKQKWSEARLQKLYTFYNRKYWKSRLPTYRVKVEDLSEREFIGLCDTPSRTVLIDVAHHTSDKEVVSTLLHEMCHVGSRPTRGDPHGPDFFRQLERLLRMKAPIRIADPEMGSKKLLLWTVPRRFRLCRRMLRPLYERGRKALLRKLQRLKPTRPVESIEDWVISFVTQAEEKTISIGVTFDEISHPSSASLTWTASRLPGLATWSKRRERPTCAPGESMRPC